MLMQFLPQPTARTSRFAVALALVLATGACHASAPAGADPDQVRATQAQQRLAADSARLSADTALAQLSEQTCVLFAEHLAEMDDDLSDCVASLRELDPLAQLSADNAGNIPAPPQTHSACREQGVLVARLPLCVDTLVPFLRHVASLRLLAADRDTDEVWRACSAAALCLPEGAGQAAISRSTSVFAAEQAEPAATGPMDGIVVDALREAAEETGPEMPASDVAATESSGDRVFDALGDFLGTLGRGH